MAGLDRLEGDRAAASDRLAPHRRLSVQAADLRHAILNDLRRNGPLSPDQLARRAGTSRTGILQQLRAMELAGLVSRQSVRHGVGRPRHLYDVTDDAQGLFPSNYDGLATDMLAAIETVGGDDLVRQVFDARRSQIRERVTSRLAERLTDEASLADRVRELAVIQDEQGYLCHSTIEQDGQTFRLSEHNCAIYQVAQQHPSACEAEVELFREVLDADVVRVSHIMAGDRCCSYEVRRSS
jgi:predicted ArsR family transcriptional regulator